MCLNVDYLVGSVGYACGWMGGWVGGYVGSLNLDWGWGWGSVLVFSSFPSFRSHLHS